MLMVHRSLEQEFGNQFQEHVAALVCGSPESNAFITPLPTLDIAKRMDALVNDAENRGASIWTHPHVSDDETMVPPRIVSNVTSSMRLYHEEQFGPIVPVMFWDDWSQVLSYLRSSPYGQQISVFGSTEHVDDLSNLVCRVNVESQCQRGPDYLPFTGRKSSARGTLGMQEGLDTYSIDCVTTNMPRL